MNTLLAFHSDQSIKETYFSRIQRHREADELVQGYGYWRDGKGCAVGCTLHSVTGDHRAYETELGIPTILARLEDRIFEGLSVDEAKLWPEQFLGAINVGSNLEMVWVKFCYWLLSDPEDGVVRYAKKDNTKEVITNVANGYLDWLEGRRPSVDKWMELKRAAYAADADADADAAAAARKAHYSKMAKKLIQLLQETK